MINRHSWSGLSCGMPKCVRQSASSLQILKNLYLLVLSKDLLVLYQLLLVFLVQSQHFAVFSMFCLVFQWISLHFALNYWFSFEKTMKTHRKLQNAVTVPKIPIQTNKIPINPLRKPINTNFPGSGDLTGSVQPRQPAPSSEAHLVLKWTREGRWHPRGEDPGQGSPLLGATWKGRVPRCLLVDRFGSQKQPK